MNAIKLENASFQYPSAGKPSVQNVNLIVKKGEFVVLTGGSGCGKTTITRIINGLAEKFYEGKVSGNVSVLGKNIADYPLYETGKEVGSIFQDPKSQFFASITEDEIAFGCENYGVPFEELGTRVSQALCHINGEMLKGKEIYHMSSGEKQKIAVASVNAVNPQIYVFDEPSANLDMYSVEALKKLMSDLKAAGHTIVVAEHRLYYLTDITDRFLYMKDGNIQTEWTAKELLSLTEEVRKSIGIRAVSLDRIATDIPDRPKEKESVLVDQLTFFYHKHPVFWNLSFQAFSGDVIAVIGHNGVGKTTLSNILCGMQKEKSGKIRYNGKVMPVRKRKKAAYFVMQNTDGQLFGDSVFEELKLNGKDKGDNRITEILELYGLLEIKDRHPATLSGGQKQRLTLAVSDWIDKPVLILDEPTSGLDYQNMYRISQHIKALAGEGKTILIITHDYEFAAMTCNRALFFGGGSKVEEFSLENHLDRLHEYMLRP